MTLNPEDIVNGQYDIVCLSHLRWDFVFQRPQHLLIRFASGRRVLYIEEPVFDSEEPRIDSGARPNGVIVAVPHLPENMRSESESLQADLIGNLVKELEFETYVLWMYTPMALPLIAGLDPVIVVFDCMDELSAFAGASPDLRQRERDLLSRADVVFTGGVSLYEAKRPYHSNIHAMPSSVDTAHFAQALAVLEEPEDQASIPRPRIGFFGVIDERMDLELIRRIAELRKDWHIILIGPVVKIDPATLPRADNIHYLGQKQYAELPKYIASWDVAILPFAINESTRFISPTKTPEYMAAGKPVVSTPITDVVHPYGDESLVRIASTPEEFAEQIDAALHEDPREIRERNRVFLEDMSWDKTWDKMSVLIDRAIQDARRAQSPS